MSINAWIAAAAGLLVCPLAHGSIRPTSLERVRPIPVRNLVLAHPVRDLPLYEVAPISIRTKDLKPYYEDIGGLARRVFVERTPHSLMVGARILW